MDFREWMKRPVFVAQSRTAAIAWRLIRDGRAGCEAVGYSTLRLAPSQRTPESLRLRALVAAEARRERRMVA